MDPVTLDDLTLDLDAWAAEFDRRRPEMIAHRRARRVDLGDLMTLDFEDRETVRWQVNRMVGVERITEVERVRHELATYNVLVPGTNELCATLLIGIDDVEQLQRWKPLLVGVNDALFLAIDGHRVQLIPDREADRAGEPPMVQYVRWVLTDDQAQTLRDGAPVEVGIDHPNYAITVTLSREQASTLTACVG